MCKSMYVCMYVCMWCVSSRPPRQNPLQGRRSVTQQLPRRSQLPPSPRCQLACTARTSSLCLKNQQARRGRGLSSCDAAASTRLRLWLAAPTFPSLRGFFVALYCCLLSPFCQRCSCSPAPPPARGRLWLGPHCAPTGLCLLLGCRPLGRTGHYGRVALVVFAVRCCDGR